MKQFSTVDLIRGLREVTHAATRGPVAITQYRKPRFVLMAIEDYERLANPRDTRSAHLTSEMPPEHAAIFIPALEKMAAADDENDG